MAYVLIMLLGALGGGICVFVALDQKRRRLAEQDEQLKYRESKLVMLTEETSSLKAKLQHKVITYEEWENENAILKRDLQNIDVNLRKLELDREVQREAQEKLDQKCQDLASRYFKENVKWIGSALTPNNFVNCKQRLLDVIGRSRGIGFEVTEEEEVALVADLKKEFESMVRAAFEREEQARAKAQIREDDKVRREIDRELQRLERERASYQAALEKARAETKDEHSKEVEWLKAKIAEAEENSQRTKARAEMTRSGHVYVISNIGSFGEGVFKIGMTRRLEPQDRVRELGDASVPFPFDVHMMISADDAPALENALHRELHKLRMNKINPRKEFFKVDIENIRQIVEEHHGEVRYTADPEALQYRQSLVVSDEDEEFIESVYDSLADDGEVVGDDS